MAQPLVSIITPSFNQGQFIEETICSVLAQDYPAIEYLVMDGGSSDGTVAILGRYEGRLRWVSAPDAGQADAIRRGFERTSGEILAWINADDRYLPGAVAAAVAALQQRPEVGLLYGDADHIDVNGGLIEHCWHIEPFSMQRLLEFGDYIVQPATFFRRRDYEAVGQLDTALHYCMDYDLWIRLAHRHPPYYLRRRLAEARLHPVAKTATGGLRRLDEIEAMVRRYGRTRLPASFYPEMVVACSREAVTAARAGQRRVAARTLLRGAGYSVIYAARRLRYGRTWKR